ncbi:MAG: topoisomerase DNA-binding C4 zinc finger domain-containing protein [Lachnospiraceae bacterium]
MLGDKKGRKIDKYVKDYVVFDLETTGISVQSDAVIEISAVKVQKGKVTDEFSTLVNPERPIPWQASKVNNIYDDMVARAPVFEKALADFDHFIGEMILAGHNIHTFDMKFIWRDAQKYWGKTISNDYIDTLSLAKQCLPQLSHYKLSDLASHYNISTAGAHRALADCGMNQKVFEKLGEELASPRVQENLRLCPKCGQFLKKRSGRYGEFWGCSGYPACRYTENA